MENMMTFQNSHFTWLEASRRSLPRPRRLPRNQLPNQISYSSLPCSLFNAFSLITAKINNLGGAGHAGVGMFIF